MLFIEDDGFELINNIWWDVLKEVNASAVNVNSKSAIWTQKVQFLCPDYFLDIICAFPSAANGPECGKHMIIQNRESSIQIDLF